MMSRYSRVLAALAAALLSAQPALAGKPAALKIKALGKATVGPGVMWSPAITDDVLRSAATVREALHDKMLKATFAQRLLRSGRAAAALAPALSVPLVSTLPIREADEGVTGFNGLTVYQQALAGPGGGSVEPPDQALCVANGFVVEAVNDALIVYDKKGKTLAGPVQLSLFFSGLPANDPNANVFSDPRCMHDAATDRWFVTVVEYNFDSTGAISFSAVDIAVSGSGDPTAGFGVYQLDVTNDEDGFTGAYDCPCIGDQPLIGSDANGFYVSTNSYGQFSFEGAQLYAISKKDLINFSPTLRGKHFDPLSFPPYFALTDPEGAFSLQPAITPPGDGGEKGTQYLVQSLAAFRYENQIGVWAISNTAALDTDASQTTIALQRLGTQVYGQPVDAIQRAGPTPLAVSTDMAMQNVAANDVRMQQVVFAGGKLYTGLTTAAYSPGQMIRDAVAWFVVGVNNPASGLQASIAQQGYLAADENASLLFPAVAVNSRGDAAFVFSVVGPTQFPSAAYWRFGGHSIHVAGEGSAPEDGFSAYLFARPRWGDYSAAGADTDGSLWMATEFIPDSTRRRFANWGTFVTRLRPADRDHDDWRDGD